MGSVRAKRALAWVRRPDLARALGAGGLGHGQVHGQVMSGLRWRSPGGWLAAGAMKVDLEHATSGLEQTPGAAGWHGGQWGCILSLNGGSRLEKMVKLTLPVRAVRVQTLTLGSSAPCPRL